jgi:Lrp/AsnC family transcriptional regulator for asnA, asnC and gidA
MVEQRMMSPVTRETSTGPSAAGAGPAPRALLDDTSRAIIAALQTDGRRPYAAIGKEVGLSETAVRQRVQRLVDAGLLQIVAITDPRLLGFTRAAMLGVRVDGDPTVAASAIGAIDAVTYVVVTAGSFDLLVEVVCRDDDQLLDLARRVRAVPDVRETEMFVYLQLTKESYTWGQPSPAAVTAVSAVPERSLPA